jgi:hypothetical protein
LMKSKNWPSQTNSSTLQRTINLVIYLMNYEWC